VTTKRYRLILHGTNFDANSKVFVNGAEVQTELISATELRAKLPAGKIGSIGNTMVQIRTTNNLTSNVLRF
jgi:hypothetical protein